MAVVFAGFRTSGEALVGSIALALTVGGLVDAFVVRMVIVPATLTLLGSRSWWLPGWLDRVLPTIDTEGRTLESPSADEGLASQAASGLKTRPARSHDLDAMWQPRDDGPDQNGRRGDPGGRPRVRRA